jgi:hypothetical protein
MNNPWKLATIGLALTGVTALSTGLTTIYVMRAPAVAEAQPAAPLVRYQVAASTLPTAQRAATRTAPIARPVATPVAADIPGPAATDCATGTDRAMRIAKPGLVGTLLGAGLGAAGGAIAKGGEGAGKGALIGGLAGAALGTGYGAYKTKNDCGTIFGEGDSKGRLYRADVPTVSSPDAALHRRVDDGHFTVYSVQ